MSRCSPDRVHGNPSLNKPQVWLPGGGVQARLAYCSMPVKSRATAGSSPTTQPSCPGGITKASPGLRSNSVPSSITMCCRPEMTYPVCEDWHDSVPAIGLMCSDHFQPGSKTARPTVTPPSLTMLAFPLSTKGRVSSGESRFLTSGFAIPSSFSRNLEASTVAVNHFRHKSVAEGRRSLIQAPKAAAPRPTPALGAGGACRPGPRDDSMVREEARPA